MRLYAIVGHYSVPMPKCTLPPSVIHERQLCPDILQCNVNLSSQHITLGSLSQVLLCIYLNDRTAAPLSSQAPGDRFSEGRALRLIERLAIDFPHRQVSFPMPPSLIPVYPCVRSYTDKPRVYPGNILFACQRCRLAQSIIVAHQLSSSGRQGGYRHLLSSQDRI